MYPKIENTDTLPMHLHQPVKLKGKTSPKIDITLPPPLISEIFKKSVTTPMSNVFYEQQL